MNKVLVALMLYLAQALDAIRFFLDKKEINSFIVIINFLCYATTLTNKTKKKKIKRNRPRILSPRDREYFDVSRHRDFLVGIEKKKSF